MVNRSVLFLGVLALAGCPSHPDGGDISTPGGTHTDARDYRDARVYQDAPPDARPDAPVPPVRYCNNADHIISPTGTETLTLQFRCGDPSDAGSVLAKLHGAMGTAETEAPLTFSLNCGTSGQLVNQAPLSFAAGVTTTGSGSGTTTVYYPLTVQTVTGMLFELTCS